MPVKDKRMDTFARETFKLGTLRGFKYFSPELRGREEMLLSISVAQSAAGQLNLQALGGSGALPPASPCQRERPKAPWEESDVPADATVDCTFLLAGYAHYNCPHAWIRAGHEVFGSAFAAAPDAPIDLAATADWRSRTVHAFEFVGEIVCATMRPPPANPFALDLSVLEQERSVTEQCLLSGSLASFLRDVHLSSAPFAAEVESDLLHLLQFHYSRLPKLLSMMPPVDGMASGGGGGGSGGGGMRGGGASASASFTSNHSNSGSFNHGLPSVRRRETSQQSSCTESPVTP